MRRGAGFDVESARVIPMLNISHDELIAFFRMNDRQQDKFRAKKWAERYRADSLEVRQEKIERWAKRFAKPLRESGGCACCFGDTQNDKVCYRCQFWAESVEYREYLHGKNGGLWTILFGRALDIELTRQENRVLARALFPADQAVSNWAVPMRWVLLTVASVVLLMILATR